MKRQISAEFAKELRRRVFLDGRTWPQWEQVSGYDANHLRRVFNNHEERAIQNMGESAIVQIANAVGLPMGPAQPTWDNLPPLISLHAALAGRVPFRKTWLTFSNCLLTFCLGAPMRNWFGQRQFRKRGWPEYRISKYLADQKVTNEAMLARHLNGSLIHRILVQQSIFTEAINADPETGRTAIDTLKDLAGGVMLSICSDTQWTEVRKTMALHCDYSTCCSLSVIDQEVVVYRPECGGERLVSDAPRLVQNCKNAIEFALRKAPALTLNECIKYLDGMLPLRNRKSRPR